MVMGNFDYLEKNLSEILRTIKEMEEKYQRSITLVCVTKSGSDEELLELATPTYVVASCGEDNKYGHPHSEVLERIKNLKLFRTDKDGSIVFSIISDTISIKTEK